MATGSFYWWVNHLPYYSWVNAGALSSATFKIAVSSSAYLRDTAADYYSEIESKVMGNITVSVSVAKSVNDPRNYCLKLSGSAVLQSITGDPFSMYFYEVETGQIWFSWLFQDYSGANPGETLTISFDEDEILLFPFNTTEGSGYFAAMAQTILNRNCPATGQDWFFDNDIKITLLYGWESAATFDPDATLAELLTYDVTGGGVSLTGKAYNASSGFMAAAATITGYDVIFDAVLLYDATDSVPILIDFNDAPVDTAGKNYKLQYSEPLPYLYINWML